MPPSEVHHPIQAAIEDIWSAGHTPRIQVDARREGVTVPEFVKDKWGPRLVLDLDASWPLNLEYGAKGIEVDLAFRGLVTRCSLPWQSIYVVLDRATGRGIVIESHAPKQDDAPKAEAPPKPADPPKAEPSVSDEEAKKRRARFKVIDGGG
jgi:stringent starvation protein B